MKKSLLALAVALSSVAHAESSSIEIIEVTANRVKQDINSALASISVFSADDIAALNPQDLPSLLSYVAGLDLTRNGGLGHNSSVFMRGNNSNGLLVLVNGQRIGSATLGTTSLANIPLANISRVEVVKGPRAAWYGADAVAGVILITTQSQGKSQLSAKVGSHDYQQYQGSLSGQFDTVDVGMQLSQERSRGFDVHQDQNFDDDGYEMLSGQVELGYRSGFGDWRIKAQQDRGNTEFDSSWGADQADIDNDQLSLQWQYQQQAWQQQLQLSQSNDDVLSFKGDKANGSRIATRRQQAEYQISWQQDDAQYVAGSEWRNEDVSGSDTDFSKDGELFESRRYRAVFTGGYWQWQSWLANLALRYDEIEAIDNALTYSTALGYQFSPAWQLRANYGTAFKAPTFNDLYYPWGGNPALQPEQSHSTELALSYQVSGFSWQAQWFSQRVTDLIQWTPDDQDNWTPKNVASASIDGVEMTVNTEWFGAEHALQLTVLDHQDQQTGKPLLNRAERLINYRISKQWQELSWWLSWQYQGERQTTGGALPSFAIWSTALNYQVTSQWRLTAKAENLFNKQYQSNRGYRTAGSEVFVSVQYQF